MDCQSIFDMDCQSIFDMDCQSIFDTDCQSIFDTDCPSTVHLIFLAFIYAFLDAFTWLCAVLPNGHEHKQY
jgi:hypothetical protein